MKYRICSRTDEIGTYWWIENRMMLFWWQYEPGYHLSKEAAERRLQELLNDTRET